MKSDSFPEKKFASDFYTHELKVLLGLANLGEIKNDPVVRSHWDVVSGWSEQARYVIGKSEQDARDLYNAIESQVLPWSKARY